MAVLSCILVLFWALALLNVLLNLLLAPRPDPAAPPSGPMVSIIVPARDEARSIERSVRSMLAQHYHPLEVIVVDDRSTDETGAILQRIAAGDPRLIIVQGEEPPAGWMGKPWALHQGSLRARGTLLLFVDADVRYEPQTVRVAVSHLDRTGMAMTVLIPRFDVEGFWELVAMPTVLLTAYMMPLWLGDGRAIWWLGIGAGTGNLVRRDDYQQSGGHETLRAAVVDDVALAHQIRRHGRRTDMLQTEGLVSVRMYHGLREIVRGFTKNMFAVAGHGLVAGTAITALSLFFHLLPFLLLFTGSVWIVATVALIMLARAVLFVPFRYPLWSALLLHPLQALIFGWIMVRSLWIVGIRRQLTWRGRNYDPAQTRFGGGR